jgi:hypothetical protein
MEEKLGEISSCQHEGFVMHGTLLPLRVWLWGWPLCGWSIGYTAVLCRIVVLYPVNK